MTIDRTKTNRNKTKQGERDTTSGQPKDSAVNPVKQEWRDNRENKGKTKAKHKKRNKANSKEDRGKTLEREEMDWTGQD